MSLEVMITMVGLVVAGLAAIVGIWVERDARKPPRYAYGLSVLILMATFVGMFQTYQDAKQGEKLESDMARILATLDKVAAEHGEDIPELNEMVKTEIAAQNRAVSRVADPMHGLPVSLDGGTVKCTVGPKNFRLLSFTK